jgi:hypothetical protein
MKKLLATAAMAAFLPLSAHSMAIDLTGQGYFTYGNTNSYSLPIMAAQYDAMFGGGTGPGNPYYVGSSPGAIKDQLVIYTGANGSDVTTNVAGFDNAYGTPNGSSPTYASIAGAVNVVDPGDKAGIANNDTNTWDANLLNLKGFLDGGTALFLFNNNDTNADQNLAIWAKLWITDANNQLVNDRYLYLSNQGGAYGFGGTPFGNATLYNPGDVLPTTGFASTDFVLSGGEVNGINHNLGANQAAYAADLPLLNAWLDSLFMLGDVALGGYTLHLDLKLGCVSTTAWGGTCDNVKIDNGFEQLFLVSNDRDLVVPEPGALLLTGIALLGLAAATRRRRSD